ncbi:MAG: exodeoxyribonuclease I [Deltaproteobacteria bacterium]|nr:exodeoxyribonuclease I [Deltaproteobacteria bacterium]
MKTYLFYDIETSGLNHAFDQVLTFACIRTDLELNELDRQTITISLRKDIVPSPKAFLTHGLTLYELEQGVCEYKAAIKIHKILNTPGTISLGYNSLGFDDEFLRFLFYRNLLDPYTHQYSKGCCRMDILPIAVIFRVFHPGCLKWPEVDGKPSLKLDLISRENDFLTSGRAHEAMSDVEAVILLAKKFYQQKNIWNYCLDFFNKLKDEARINKIEESFCLKSRQFKVCIMMSASFGSKVNYMAPVLQLGQSTVYKNQSLWLRLDLDDVLGLTSNKDLNETFVVRRRAGEALIVLPALERFWNKLSKPSKKAAQTNMEKIRHHHEKFFEFIQYHLAYKYPFISNIDPDAALYQEGFFSSLEKKQSSLFHKTPDTKKHEFLSEIKSHRIKKLAARIIARNFEDEKSGTKDSEFNIYLNKLRSPLEEDRIHGYKNDIKFNREQGLCKLKEIEHELLNPDQGQRKMLCWLKDCIENL